MDDKELGNWIYVIMCLIAVAAVFIGSLFFCFMLLFLVCYDVVRYEYILDKEDDVVL